MSDHNIQVHERLARIEERLKQLDDLSEQVTRMDKQLTLARGKLGGILIVVAAITTAFKLWGASITGFFVG